MSIEEPIQSRKKKPSHKFKYYQASEFMREVLETFEK